MAPAAPGSAFILTFTPLDKTPGLLCQGKESTLSTQMQRPSRFSVDKLSSRIWAKCMVSSITVKSRFKSYRSLRQQMPVMCCSEILSARKADSCSSRKTPVGLG